MKSNGIEVLFPRFCLGCGYLGSYVCPACEKKMTRVKEPRCLYCEKPSLLGLTHPSCKQKDGVDGHLALYFYDGLFKKILHESKYKGAVEALKTLLSFPQQRLVRSLQRWNRLFLPTVITVPLHEQRLRERGFNQSELIQSSFFNKEHIKEIFLERVINTEHLANIGNKNKRKKHIAGAFTFVGSFIPKNVVLIDDVITSGATIFECTKILKRAGVQTVLAFSLAKG